MKKKYIFILKRQKPAYKIGGNDEKRFIYTFVARIVVVNIILIHNSNIVVIRC